MRLVLGLHFVVEGTSKLRESKPFTAPFFSSARGPAAPIFKGLVWDADGLHRLDREATLQAWDNFRNHVVRHYGFEEKQKELADEALKKYSGRYSAHLAEKSEAIDEYRQWLTRRDQNTDDPMRRLASLQVHDVRIATETKKLYGEIIPPIDSLWKNLELDLNSIATDKQWQRHGWLSISKIGRRFGDSETMDAVMPYFDLAVGVCLLVGLFTRPAAILGALFLATVFISHFPPEPGPGSTYYHLVELTALLALAAIGAGRYFGLDYFLGGLKSLCCRGKKTGEPT